MALKMFFKISARIPCQRVLSFIRRCLPNLKLKKNLSRSVSDRTYAIPKYSLLMQRTHTCVRFLIDWKLKLNLNRKTEHTETEIAYNITSCFKT
jgi:hypothetical protein